jgi:flagellar motor switch/type III secretory pathway protein FliN
VTAPLQSESPLVGTTDRPTERVSRSSAWEQLAELWCCLTVDLPVPDVTVADILHLLPGKVLNTGWKTNRDLPLLVNGRRLGGGEFDAATETLGVRITEFIWEQQS